MTAVRFSSELTVDYRDHMGNDDAIIEAMLVSTKGADALDAKADFGRINFLARNRHGSPFEHTALKFYVRAPIAVFREWHRHRIGFSYNETSGRYRQLEPDFYLPPPERPLVQVGKPGAYTYAPGSPDQYDRTIATMKSTLEAEYEAYERLLADGVAKEVARGVLGVYLYTDMIVTLNARSAMAFLSLRTQFGADQAMFPSTPMWEIARCADQLEATFAELFPLTHRAFTENKRVCP